MAGTVLSLALRSGGGRSHLQGLSSLERASRLLSSLTRLTQLGRELAMEAGLGRTARRLGQARRPIVILIWGYRAPKTVGRTGKIKSHST